MGSLIEINDTLQLTADQGFPAELNLDEHLKTPIEAERFANKTFKFSNKANIRIYQVPPVRCFLAENRGGKWIYWGLVHILSLELDYQTKTTSGTFKIIYINSPAEMRKSFELTDQNPEHNYFANED